MENLKQRLLKIAQEALKPNDPSHDFHHALRVLKNAEIISSQEGGDLAVIIPAALFHDVICYPKNSAQSYKSSIDSAEVASKILYGLKEYPQNKIKMVYTAISQCSFKKNISPNLLEAKILQDADRLEATGAIAIMRTFAYGGLINSKLYHSEDPFCKERSANSCDYALDLFFTRLLKVKNMMHTKTGRAMAEERTKILHNFLKSLEKELDLNI